MNKYAIILAAGKGTRMKSKNENISKVSFKILDKPLLKYVLDALKPLNFTQIVTVVGFGGKMSSEIAKNDSDICWQLEQKGSGHAVMMTRDLLGDKKGQTIVCCGDTPLLKSETIEALFAYHNSEKAALTIMTSVIDNPFGYGRIVKKNGQIERIVEQKDASDEEKAIKEVNAGVYIFNNEELFEALKHINTNNASGEYYLTDVIKIFVDKKLKVTSFPVDFEETLGVNDRYQLYIAFKILQKRINKKHCLNGITIEDLDNTYISSDVKIGQDTIIKPNSYIYGDTTIGENNIIGPNTYLNNVKIGDNNSVIFSHLEDTTIESSTTLGPYLRTRKNTIIRSNTHIGNFNELKNIDFMNGSKCAHLSYLGDATIGKNVNVGCGVIIANYDGVNKFHTEIGDNVFLGSGSTYISPLKISNNAFIAAGSTINKDVNENDLAIARARQENKPKYAKIIREKALNYKNNK